MRCPQCAGRLDGMRPTGHHPTCEWDDKASYVEPTSDRLKSVAKGEVQATPTEVRSLAAIVLAFSEAEGYTPKDWRDYL